MELLMNYGNKYMKVIARMLSLINGGGLSLFGCLFDGGGGSRNNRILAFRNALFSFALNLVDLWNFQLVIESLNLFLFLTEPMVLAITSRMYGFSSPICSLIWVLQDDRIDLKGCWVWAFLHKHMSARHVWKEMQDY